MKLKMLIMNTRPMEMEKNIWMMSSEIKLSVISPKKRMMMETMQKSQTILESFMKSVFFKKSFSSLLMA